jgi:hypothetical protein
MVVSCAVAALIMVGFRGFSYDDAFITYRYAARLAEGHGLTFNDGERIYGTTANGYALLLGALTWLGRPFGWQPPHWGSLTGCAGLLLACWAVLGVRARALRERAFAIGLLAAVLLTQRWHIELLGGEAPVLAGVLITAFVVAFEQKRPVVAGLLGSFAACGRGDAALAIAAIGIGLWWSERKFPWRFAAASGLPTFLFYTAIALYYGSLVPHSYLGKREEMVLVETGYSAMQWSWLLRCFSLPGTIALFGLAILGIASGLKWNRRLTLALVSWVATLEAFYRLAGVVFAPWYHVAALVVLIVLGSLCASRAVARVPSDAAGAPSAADRAAGAIALSLALWLAMAGASWIVKQWRRPPDPRQRIYEQTGAFLAGLPEGRVAAIEIGVLGYVSRQPILDLVGLVSEEALAARRAGGLVELLEAQPPRYAVDVSLFSDQYPLTAWLASRKDYREIARFEDPASGRGEVRVLELGAPAFLGSEVHELGKAGSGGPARRRVQSAR